jgi:predicted TIM-barrel fold metal-dependent hydrolase
MLVCDAQVHAPHAPNYLVPGIDYDDLIAEMAVAGVDRAVIIPLGDEVDPEPALEFVRRAPERFVVVGRPPVAEGPTALHYLEEWSALPGMAGVRVSFFSEAVRARLLEEGLEWVWEAAVGLDIPIMISPNGLVSEVGDIARRHPTLRLALDHMGLIPFKVYNAEELRVAVDEVVALANFPQVSVKATALASSVDEPYPFPSLHEPLRRVIEAFGPKRVFWGSDMTRLPCTYDEYRRLFTEELDFLTEEDKRWIMGQAVSEWLGWPTG